jgi:hypothetical protein
MNRSSSASPWRPVAAVSSAVGSISQPAMLSLAADHGQQVAGGDQTGPQNTVEPAGPRWVDDRDDQRAVVVVRTVAGGVGSGPGRPWARGGGRGADLDVPAESGHGPAGVGEPVRWCLAAASGGPVRGRRGQQQDRVAGPGVGGDELFDGGLKPAGRRPGEAVRRARSDGR